jgi:hypothetical protein
LLHSHKSCPIPLNDKRQIIVWFSMLKHWHVISFSHCKS